nr:dihydrolipoamide acetyltransferase family protein [Pullulanibacillus camelliae]
MPKLGESVTEGTISRWLVSVGDTVKKYDPIAEVTTDKVNSEVPTSYAGQITALIADEGDTLEVGAVICTIEVEGSEQADGDAPKPVVAEKQQVPNNTQSANQSMKKRYSPAVLRLAQENDIDLEHVEGTGKGGRITRKDMQKLIAEGAQSPQVKAAVPEPTGPQAQSAAPSEPAFAMPSSQGDVEVPITGVRRAIATNMLKSVQEAPHAWTMVEVDVTDLVSFRNKIKGDFKAKEGFNLTFLPFFIKATVEALREFPRMNSMWAGDKIIEKKDINISIAVATDEALYVPVIKHADELSIKGIGRSVNHLAQKVRSNQLSTDDMQGGTFTVNNTGSFGSVLSQPIINHPQAAILSVESIVKRPVIMEGGMIAARDIVNLCLSLDHRILDGLIAGRFLARVKEKLEHMSAKTTSIY